MHWNKCQKAIRDKFHIWLAAAWLSVVLYILATVMDMHFHFRNEKHIIDSFVWMLKDPILDIYPCHDGSEETATIKYSDHMESWIMGDVKIH